MPRPAAVRSICLALAVALSGASGCDDSTGPSEDHNFPQSGDIAYTAINSGPNNIHIYMLGGSRSNANQVVPGTPKSLHTSAFTWDSESDFVNVQFEASSNLGDIAFGTIAYTGRHRRDGRSIRVTWNGSGTLAVVLQ